MMACSGGVNIAIEFSFLTMKIFEPPIVVMRSHSFCNSCGYKAVPFNALFFGYINETHVQTPESDGKYGYAGKSFQSNGNLLIAPTKASSLGRRFVSIYGLNVGFCWDREYI